MVKRHRREPGHTTHGTVLYSTHVHLVKSTRNQVKSAEASADNRTEKTCEPDTEILVLLCVVFARWDRTPNTLSESDTVVCERAPGMLASNFKQAWQFEGWQ